MDDTFVRCINPTLCAELRGELEATRALLEATRSQLSGFIADFCALRDALPRERVEQILRQGTRTESASLYPGWPRPQCDCPCIICTGQGTHCNGNYCLT